MIKKLVERKILGIILTDKIGGGALHLDDYKIIDCITLLCSSRGAVT